MLQDIKVRVKKKSNLTQSAILESARAFQLGVTLHERRSPFSRCYCANSYVNNFCRSFVFLVFLSITVRNVCSLGSLKGQRTPSECEMKRTRTRLRLSGL